MNWVANQATDGGRTGPELPGRARELRTLATMVDQAAAGHGSVMLLRGPAGTGKTALLARARELAAGRDLEVLSCYGVRAEAQLPFAALHQLLRPAARDVPGMTSGHREVLRDALSLDQRLACEPHRVALAVLELLSAVAAKQPLLVVGDDAHWLDRPSADVLAFVSRRIATEPIAVVLSLRDGDGDPFQAAGLPSLSISALAERASQARARMLLSVAAAGARHRLAAYRLTELCEAAAAASGELVRAADLQPAIDFGLVRLEGDRVMFAHPLIPAAICQSLPAADRQHIQHALARLKSDGDGRRQGARQLLHPVGSPELTPQELQIAQLAAGGLSNRQIAQQLSVSHRTVGSHLYHLFPKLGITTRVQLAHALESSTRGRLAS